LSRRKWRIQDGGYPKGERGDKLRQIDQVPEGWILHPHFPQLSYLEHRLKERWKRIERIRRQPWHWLAVAWSNLAQRRRDWLEGLLKCTHVPSSPLLEGPVEIVPMAIPGDWRDEDIV